MIFEVAKAKPREIYNLLTSASSPRVPSLS